MKSELEYVLKELAQYIIYGEENIQNMYQKEKIVKLDKNISDINKIYKKFHQIEENNHWRMLEDEIFYKQAKYLEDFEDNYETNQTHRNSYSYYRENNSTYTSFSFRDFRTYFSWRGKIRKGIFKKIEWDYEQIYINELLNKIGCKDTDEATIKLIDFWKGYRECEPTIDQIMPNIIKEFYITNTINMKYEEIVEKYPITIKNISKDIKEIKKGIYTNKIDFLNDISTYKIAKSKLLETKYGYLLDECIEKVFTKLHQELQKNNISLPDMLVYKNMTEHWWIPLSGYSIYEKGERIQELIIQGTEKYECKNGVWKRTIYSAHNRYRNITGYILKTMEYYIREYLGYRKLKLPQKSEILKDIYEYYCSNKERVVLQKIHKIDLQTMIQIQTFQYLQSINIPKMIFKKKKEEQCEFEKEEKIEISFNQEQFDKLRKKSEEIQKALIIDEEYEEKQQKIEKKEVTYKEVAKTITKTQKLEVNTNENIFKTFVCELTQSEKEIVQILLQKQEVQNKMIKIAQSQNEMLEIIVSNINDKALETIGDTIIESNMESIYEDYEDEIKQII